MHDEPGHQTDCGRDRRFLEQSGTARDGSIQSRMSPLAILVLASGLVGVVLAYAWCLAEAMRYAPAIVGVSEQVARWSCLSIVLLAFAGFAACGTFWVTREETARIGNREEMQRTLTLLVPTGTEAGEATCRLQGRGSSCDPAAPSEAADWPKPRGDPGYEPLPAGAEAIECTRRNDLLIGLAFWRVGLVLAEGRVSRVIVLANFRAPL